MRALVPLAAAAALTVTAPSAHAYRANVGLFTAGGFAIPGITAVPTANRIDITGAATLYGAYGSLAVGGSDVGRVVPCVIGGNGTESVAVGFGGLYGACGPIPFDRCTYVRVVASMTLVCANGTTAEWVFTPVDSNPTRYFNLTGTIHYATAP